jgi:hypothetical protein
VVERLVPERQLERIGLPQGCLDACPRQVLAGEIELLRLDVDAKQTDAREFLPENRQRGGASQAGAACRR